MQMARLTRFPCRRTISYVGGAGVRWRLEQRSAVRQDGGGTARRKSNYAVLVGWEWGFASVVEGAAARVWKKGGEWTFGHEGRENGEDILLPIYFRDSQVLPATSKILGMIIFF
jgi:hypothetical protein